jgi:hypothetical protein
VVFNPPNMRDGEDANDCPWDIAASWATFKTLCKLKLLGTGYQ